MLNNLLQMLPGNKLLPGTIQKSAEAIGDFILNKIVDKITELSIQVLKF